MRRAGLGAGQSRDGTGGPVPEAEARGLALLENAGLQGESLDRFCRLASGSAGGVILVTGPDRAGRVQALEAMVCWLKSRAVKLVSLEDREEDAGRKRSVFARVLRPVLRRKPDVIILGRIRDSETAKLAIMAVTSGCLVLATMEAGGAAEAVDRLLEIGLEPSLIAGTVKGIVSQRAVRRLCSRCRRPYTPSLDELMELGMSPGDYLFYRAVGCEACSGSGYEGSAGAFEVLAVTPAMSRAICRQSRGELERAIGASGFQSITDSCRQLVLDGTASVDEIRRVLGGG